MSNQPKPPQHAPKGALGKAIADARTSRKDRLGRRDLAKLSGLPESLIKYVELGIKIPSVEQCIKLASALGLPNAELINRRNWAITAKERITVKFRVSHQDADLVAAEYGIHADLLSRQLLTIHLAELREKRAEGRRGTSDHQLSSEFEDAKAGGHEHA